MNQRRLRFMAGSDVFHKLFLRPENPRAPCPPHLLHNSSLLLNLFYFCWTFLLDVSEFSSSHVIFEIFVRFFSRTKVLFLLSPVTVQTKKKKLSVTPILSCHSMLSPSVYFIPILFMSLGTLQLFWLFWHPRATVLRQEKLLAVDNLSPWNTSGGTHFMSV